MSANGKQAVEYANKACDLTGWKNANYLSTLAAAYAEVGNFDEATKWQTKCIESNERPFPTSWQSCDNISFSTSNEIHTMRTEDQCFWQTYCLLISGPSPATNSQ